MLPVCLNASGPSIIATNTCTDAQIKQTALEEAPFAAEEAWVDDVAQSQPSDPEAVPTDPTIANAGLTELNDSVPINGRDSSADVSSVPPVSSIDAGASNAAGGDWEKTQSGSDDPLTESYEMVPRDPAETESPAVAAPVNETRSWADDPVDMQAAAPTNGNDGFQEVHNSRGGRGRNQFQGEGRGGYRGRGGPRGGGRGGRGRGRGDGFRGGRGGGGFRGGPRGGDVQ